MYFETAIIKHNINFQDFVNVMQNLKTKSYIINEVVFISDKYNKHCSIDHFLKFPLVHLRSFDFSTGDCNFIFNIFDKINKSDVYLHTLLISEEITKNIYKIQNLDLGDTEFSIAQKFMQNYQAAKKNPKPFSSTCFWKVFWEKNKMYGEINLSEDKTFKLSLQAKTEEDLKLKDFAKIVQSVGLTAKE